MSATKVPPGNQTEVLDGSASKSVRTRERILAATADVLNTKGYAGTRLNDIAIAADLQAPAIYYYFGSREEVIEEVVLLGQRRVIEHVGEALAEAPTDIDPVDRILVASEAHLVVILTLSQFASASIRNFGQLPAAMQGRLEKLRRQYGRIWRDLFTDASKQGTLDPALDPDTARLLVLGALNWTTEWWTPKRSPVSQTVNTTQTFISKALRADS